MSAENSVVPPPPGLVDLAAARVGGIALFANDEFFAGKENLLKPGRGIFIEGKYTDRGKWMDGWETRRRRTPGYDWCIVQLGVTGIPRGVVVDTAYFKVNSPQSCSLEACDDLAAAQWNEILPESPLKGDCENLFSLEA